MDNLVANIVKLINIIFNNNQRRPQFQRQRFQRQRFQQRQTFRRKRGGCQSCFPH